MTLLLGCIADDLTGGTDLASVLVKAGMRTEQTFGVPKQAAGDDVEALVISLKTRTVPVETAVNEALEALRWLRAAGCRQFYFKYCSTFDSTPEGNIGPVAEALLSELNDELTAVCPAFPANGRTVYQGHLFVGETLLSESGMQHHPLTPMTDANVRRLLQAQVKSHVGLVSYPIVRQGATAISERLSALAADGHKFAVIDALNDEDLLRIAETCAGLRLITGGSGLALGLPENFRRAGLLGAPGSAADLPPTNPRRAVIAGSCSLTTQRQVAAMRAKRPAFYIDPMRLIAGDDLVSEALAWAEIQRADGPLLFYSTAAIETVLAAQGKYGSAFIGTALEEVLAAITLGLVRSGYGQLIVAGGETSGAVVKTLGINRLRIGKEIAPGVPWTTGVSSAAGDRTLSLALKSGNFGGDGFFLEAWSYLQT